MAKVRLLKPELSLASASDLTIPLCVSTAEEAINMIGEHHGRWRAS
jgi:hypothetical protein